MKATTSIYDSIAAKHFLDLQDEETDPDVIEQALAWAESSEEARHAFNRVERFWSGCDGIARSPDALERLRGQQAAEPRHRGWLPILLPTGLAAAAGLTFAVMTPHPGSPLPGAAPTVTHYATEIGERRSVTLPDGSRILLAAASGVSVDYRHRQRLITLTDGEAIFDVAHNPQRPFVVQTGSGTITALGTEFDVNRGPRDVTVTLVHGSVAVKAGDVDRQALRLEPGMQVRYHANGRIGRPYRVDLADSLSWQRGTLHFSETELAEVVDQVNRYSVVPIIIEDPSIRALKISGTVKLDSVDSWLRGLAVATNLSISETGTAIRLHAPCNSSIV